jgi:hypothetical protein
VQIVSDDKIRNKKSKCFNNTQSFFIDWRTKNGVLQVSILGPVPFIMYIQDLPPRINTLSEPLVFGDDTDVSLHKNVDGFPAVLDIVLSRKNKWFTANKF